MRQGFFYVVLEDQLKTIAENAENNDWTGT